MCLHSQSHSHPNMALIDGIKHDLRAAINRVDVSLVPDGFIESEDWRMKEASWKTLRQLLKPSSNSHK